MLANWIGVILLNVYSKLASWHLDPASSIYTQGYGWNYDKTDE